VSASADDRVDPEWLREQLVHARCGCCEGRVDEHAHRAIYVGPSGQIIPHLICARCWNRRDHAEVAQCVQLNLTPTEGRA
jgi:hypothetical protein